MGVDETGVARLPPQQLSSYLYWYVQKLQDKKIKIKIKKDGKDWMGRIARSWGQFSLRPSG